LGCSSMEPREKNAKMSELCPDNGFSLTKKYVRFGRKSDCSLGITAELCIQSFNFRLIIRSNHLPIIHNNEIGRMSSIERKGVVFDNTNKIEGKSFEHDVRIVVNKIFD